MLTTGVKAIIPAHNQEDVGFLFSIIGKAINALIKYIAINKIINISIIIYF